MSKWSVAHSIAHIAAQRARGDAGLRPTERVDVIRMIEGIGLQVLGQHAPKLFGAYLPATDDRQGGIWLNAGLTVTGQRHTAAHELGHYVLGHGEVLDTTIASVSTGDGDAARTLSESTAEAFAAWLLMPRPALVATLTALGITSAPTPTDVYHLALVMGTSYRGTARHLAVARIIDRGEANSLMRVVPARIKARLDEPEVPSADPRADVWRVSRMRSCGELMLATGDRVIVDHDDVAAAATLIDERRAQFVAESQRGLVLAACADEGVHGTPAEVNIGGSAVRIRVAAVIRGLATPTAIPDVSHMSEDELDHLLSTISVNDSTDEGK